jgi:hypothetical protein
VDFIMIISKAKGYAPIGGRTQLPSAYPRGKFRA